MKRWVPWVGIALVVVFGGFLAGRIGLSETVPASPLIGTEAPSMALPLLESEGEVRLTDFPGEIVVANFWASWCTPCREEHPVFVAAADLYAGKGVRFVAINHEDPGDRRFEFLDTYGRSEHQFIVEDPDSRAGIEFGVFGLPETFFIDGDGVIVGRVAGAIDLPTLVDFISQIQAGEQPGAINGTVYQGP